MTRLRFRAFSRYRPRLLTVVLLLIIGALLVLANLSDEYHPRRAPKAISEADLTFDVRKPDTGSLDAPWPWLVPMWGLSKGWPLLWNQYVAIDGYGVWVAGWRYGAGRLACNVALWLVMLAAPAAACEWTLRRYRPGLRFSLRGMLAAVSLVAAFCGWFAWAGHRADTEDALTEEIVAAHGQVWFERWGPKWLDLVGADRYRRHIVAARVRSIVLEDDDAQGNAETRELLRRLTRIPALQYLFLNISDLTPDLAGRLREFPQLRMLSIESQRVFPGANEALREALSHMPALRVLSVSPGAAWGDDEEPTYDEYGTKDVQMCHQCLAAVGTAPSLERLHLEGMTIWSESLACLAGLTRLKSLSLAQVQGENDEWPSAPLLSGLPPLANLEAFVADSQGPMPCNIVDDDIPHLARLPHLKSLRLSATRLTTAGLARLASLKSLEELSLSSGVLAPDVVVTSAALESLVHLRKLHIPLEYQQPTRPGDSWKTAPRVEPGDLQRSLRALQRLRESHPGIVIDGNFFNALTWDETALVPPEYDTSERLQIASINHAIGAWKKAGCPPIPAAKLAGR